MARAVCHPCQSFRERTDRAWADAKPTLKTNMGQLERLERDGKDPGKYGEGAGPVEGRESSGEGGLTSVRRPMSLDSR